MFFPFLPYLVAVVGIFALMTVPAGAAPVGGEIWHLALIYALLPLWGVIIGNLPVPLRGTRALSDRIWRRGLYLAGWFLILALLSLPRGLAEQVGWSNGGAEIAIALLVLNFWLGEALSQHPYPRRIRAAAPAGGSLRNPGNAALQENGPSQAGTGSAWRELWQGLRLPLPVVILILAGLGWSAMTTQNWIPGMDFLSSLPFSGTLSSLAGLFCVAAVAVPLLIRYGWGLKPMPGALSQSLVREELAANGVSVAHVFSWPDEITGSSTAGVIGLLPPFRYLLISPALANLLTPDELRSVVAHEAGHIKHRHLFYLIGAAAGFILLMQLLIEFSLWLGLLTGYAPPAWVGVAIGLGVMVLFLRFGFGLVIRRFERQADGNAIRRTGPDAFAQALTKLALYNRIPLEQDNWHHYGIAQRIEHARRAGFNPQWLIRHDRRVGRLKVALVGLLLLGVTATASFSFEPVKGFLGDRVVSLRLAPGQAPAGEHLPALHFLASRAFSRNDLDAAERYFRMILTVTPESPTARNNLAWVLVTRAGAGEQALREGLGLAEAAASGDSRAFIWDTLAESYFRLGRFDQAHRAAEQALRLAGDGMGRGNAPLQYYRERLELFSRLERGKPGAG